MAPRVRVAHKQKFAIKKIITNKKLIDPVVKNKVKSFIDDEAKVTNFKRDKKLHTKVTPTADKYSYKPNYIRTFESRNRCLPQHVEDKIEHLIKFVNEYPKKVQRKQKTIPIKGLYNSKNVCDYTTIYKNERNTTGTKYAGQHRQCVSPIKPNRDGHHHSATLHHTAI